MYEDGRSWEKENMVSEEGHYFGLPVISCDSVPVQAELVHRTGKDNVTRFVFWVVMLRGDYYSSTYKAKLKSEEFQLQLHKHFHGVVI
jgi:hypothetical protein